MKPNDFKVGQEVWYTDTYGNLQSGTVEGYHETEASYAKVHGKYATQYVQMDKCHDTRDEALVAAREASGKQVQEYLKGLETPEDLVRFMYENTVSPAEEYTDLDARKAAGIAAKRILGIDLDREPAAKEPMDLKDALRQLEAEAAGQSL